MEDFYDNLAILEEELEAFMGTYHTNPFAYRKYDDGTRVLVAPSHTLQGTKRVLENMLEDPYSDCTLGVVLPGPYFNSSVRGSKGSLTKTLDSICSLIWEIGRVASAKEKQIYYETKVLRLIRFLRSLRRVYE